MNKSRIKFTFLFVVLSFAFIFITNGSLDQRPETFFGSESQTAWKSTVATILSPVKIILLGPLVPAIKWLQQDPDTPPPFFLIMFAFYWTVLAVAIHYVITRVRRKDVDAS